MSKKFDMCSKQLVINKTVVLLGHQEVGKSSILSRYVKNRYQESYKETIGKLYFNPFRSRLLHKEYFWKIFRYNFFFLGHEW